MSESEDKARGESDAPIDAASSPIMEKMDIDDKSEEEHVLLRRSTRKRRQTTFEEFAADEEPEREPEPKKKPVKLRLNVASAKKPPPKPQPKKTKTALEPEDLPWVDDSELTNQQPEADEDIPANSPSIAQIVLFQEQFPSLFEGMPLLGPQDIERGVQVAEGFSPEVETLFCRLLTLVLNRKKPVENGKYLRALEELQAQLPSLGVSEAWPPIKLKAKYKSDVIIPLTWQGRVEVLRMLTLWTVANNEQAKAIVNEVRSRPPMHGALDRFFKQADEEAEEEEAVEGVDVGPIGMDGNHQRYYLVQGYGDTEFRLYKTTNPYLRYLSWTSVASNAAEIERLINEGPLAEDGSSDARKLREKLEQALPSLQESESRRYKVLVKEEKKRQQIEELAQVRNGEGRYAGRTRGRRINYNVDEFDFGEEDDEGGAVNEGDEFNPDDEDVDDEDLNAAGGRGVRQSARLRGQAASGIEIGDNDIPVGEHGKRMVVVLKLPKGAPNSFPLLNPSHPSHPSHPEYQPYSSSYQSYSPNGQPQSTPPIHHMPPHQAPIVSQRAQAAPLIGSQTVPSAGSHTAPPIAPRPIQAVPMGSQPTQSVTFGSQPTKAGPVGSQPPQAAPIGSQPTQAAQAAQAAPTASQPPQSVSSIGSQSDQAVSSIGSQSDQAAPSNVPSNVSSIAPQPAAQPMHQQPPAQATQPQIPTKPVQPPPVASQPPVKSPVNAPANAVNASQPVNPAPVNNGSQSLASNGTHAPATNGSQVNQR